MKGLDLDASQLPMGAILRRTYKGVVYEVLVDQPHPPYGARKAINRAASRNRWWRYIYKEKRYKTLSGIAREITGSATLSGNRFFGLRRRRA